MSNDEIEQITSKDSHAIRNLALSGVNWYEPWNGDGQPRSPDRTRVTDDQQLHLPGPWNLSRELTTGPKPARRPRALMYQIPYPTHSTTWLHHHRLR